MNSPADIILHALEIPFFPPSDFADGRMIEKTSFGYTKGGFFYSVTRKIV